MLFIGFTTVSSREEAERLAHGLIDARLAACVQIDGPVSSVYRWQGKIEKSAEFRLTIKFTDLHATAVEKWLLAHHPYETPEWLAVRAEIVGEKYLSWARANSTSAPL